MTSKTMTKTRGFKERDSHMDNKKTRGVFGLPQDAEEVFLESFITGDVSGAIENQEKRGQQSLVRSSQLPKEGFDRIKLEALGFKIGEEVDDLFIAVTLPSNWAVKPTSHSMHSDVVDDKGRERIHIFYKAAFYDRSAHMYFCCRYSCGSEPVTGYGDEYNRLANEIGVVKDRGQVIWRTEAELPSIDAFFHAGIERTDQERKDYFQKDDALKAEAKAKIAEMFPDWQNPLAYWD